MGSIPTLGVPDLEAVASLHLVGLGGAGMSGLARVLLARGVAVSGCDLKDSTELRGVEAAGATVSVGHDPAHAGGADALVVSSAIPRGTPEVDRARGEGVPVWARAQVLAALMRERRGVAVAGTHGKTTTTSMLAVILEGSGRDPTYVIGGDLNESGSNARSGEGDVFVAEADESDGSFLLLSPEVAVITNVEADHLDFYGDEGRVEAAFASFCARAGTVVACPEDEGTARVLTASGVRAVTYGEQQGRDWRIGVLESGPRGCRGVLRGDADEVELVVPIPGRHHLLNAAAAVVAATLVGVDPQEAAGALRRFTGVRRRIERRGEAGGAAFVDDYAHHPTEVAATIAAAREGDGHSRVIAVFQPHRYTRTAALARELGRSLAGADLVVITDVYGAGEQAVPGVTGKLVLDALVEERPGRRAVYLPHRVDVAAFLATELREGDLVLTLGAGDVTTVSQETLARLTDDG